MDCAKHEKQVYNFIQDGNGKIVITGMYKCKFTVLSERVEASVRNFKWFAENEYVNILFDNFLNQHDQIINGMLQKMSCEQNYLSTILITFNTYRTSF